MESNKWGILGTAGLLLVAYNLTQPGLIKLRNNETRLVDPATQKKTNTREAYGPSLEWVERLARSTDDDAQYDPKTGDLKVSESGDVKLDLSVMSSLMVAGLTSGFKSQVANLLWMKSDEYWHQGLFTRQVPLMEAVVTLDPQFIDAWSTAGWHWAYNIYADIPTNPDKKAKGEKFVRQEQEKAVRTGLTYLRRGANMNPDKYRLWFEWGWTRGEKAGLYDDETLAHFRSAREQSDAKTIEISGPGGKMEKKEGLDVLGRTIGHLYERIPQFDAALDHYAGDLMKIKPDSNERKMLDKVGEFWHRYGSDYQVIGEVYQDGDAQTKAQIKALVPDVETLVAAHAMRQKIAGQVGKDQPVGAYVSISARYMPSVRLEKAGKIKEAVAQMIGVMNADPKFHLQELPVLAKIMEIKGDAPQAIKAKLDAARSFEKTSSQDLGLHFLAKLYEKAAANAQAKGDQKAFENFNLLAYKTWYRSKERDALDFYALRNTRLYEDKFDYTPPADIIKAIKDSRKGGVPNAAPEAPSGIGGYY